MEFLVYKMVDAAKIRQYVWGEEMKFEEGSEA